ncbi:unnamed protein product [Brassica rapa subsp. trilocularis]
MTEEDLCDLAYLDRDFQDLVAIGNNGKMRLSFCVSWKRSLKRQWRKVDPREEHTILVRLWSEQGSWNFYIAGVTALAEVILHWNVFLIVWRNFEIFVATAVTRATAFNLFPASCITPETGWYSFTLSFHTWVLSISMLIVF